MAMRKMILMAVAGFVWRKLQTRYAAKNAAKAAQRSAV
jgi:hypothetical protein